MNYIISLLTSAVLSLALETYYEEPQHQPQPTNFINFVTTYKFLDQGILIKEASNNVLWASAYRTNSQPQVQQGQRISRNRLVKSQDHGITWQTVHIFDKNIEVVYADGHGNIFVSISLGRWLEAPYAQLHKSTDNGATFTKVLQTGGGVPVGWNIASQNGTMFVSEYGFKGHSPANIGNNARRIYRSLDFGNTWETVFYPEPTYDWHNHTTLITTDGVVYQSIGDGANAHIKRSTDNGYNWQTVARRFHPTSALQFGDYILWGLDAGPWHGVMRYHRPTQTTSRSLTLPYPFKGSAYDMIYANGIVYAMFLSYINYSHPASIFYSKDQGHTWHILGEIHSPNAHGIGFFHMRHDDKFAYIDIQTPLYNEEEITFFRGTLRFELL